MLMPATPLAPAAMTSSMRAGVMPPMASTGSGVAAATDASSATPATGRPGFELVSYTVPKMR